MLIQERISGPDTLLKLYATIDDGLKMGQGHWRTKQLLRNARGSSPDLSAAEVLTMLVWGAWRGLGDKAKLYYYLRGSHQSDFPSLGSDSKFVEATNRYSLELRSLLAAIRHHHRQAQPGYPLVFQDSSAVAVCKVVRARPHRTVRDWARKSKTGSGWWYGFKLHVQCDTEGRLGAFDLTTATVEDRRLLDPLTRWLGQGIVVGDSGYLWQAKARALAARGLYLITTTRKNMRALASQFQLACLQLRHRVEELCEFLKCAFGLVRTTHRAPYALPIHLLLCLLAYSLYKQLTA